MRIYQLDIGIKIELWQEAFKAVEDIHFLMNLPKRSPPPKALSEFYSKLGVVFCRASMDLFHSCTQHKLFKLTRDNRKNLSQQELSLLASRMLISTISIPITQVKHGLGKMLDIENALLEKHQKMARLLDLERSPSRSSLMQDMISRYGALRLVAKPLIKLYNLIETEENTLKMKVSFELFFCFLNFFLNFWTFCFVSWTFFWIFELFFWIKSNLNYFFIETDENTPTMKVIFDFFGL